MRAVAAMGVAAASALALSGCTADGGDTPAPPAPSGSFQVREVAVEVPMAQWTQQAGDADSAAKVLASTGLDGFLTVDEYVAMVDAGCPTDPLPAEQAGWLCSQDESVAYLVVPAALTSNDVASAGAFSAPNSDSDWEIDVTLTRSGLQEFWELTSDASPFVPQGVVALVIDGRVQSAPLVMQEITGGTLILTGRWTEDDANGLVASLAG